jgi:group I intron endonuclease
MEYQGAGIYGLFNVMENKIYIGASSNIERRFANHKQNFRSKSKANPMYSEPIENFVFLILDKMTPAEFAKYGDMVEQLFIAQAQRNNFGVYNRNKTDEDVTWRARSVFQTEEKLYGAIQNNCHVLPWTIRMMSERKRRAVLENISA